MEVIRIYAESTGFDELYEGYIRSQLTKLIDKEVTEKEDDIKAEAGQ